MSAIYLAWAAQAPRLAVQNRKPRTIDAALLCRDTQRLALDLELPAEAAAWLVATTLALPYTHPRLFGDDPFRDGGGNPLLYEWAIRSPNLREGRRKHINEGRFVRWLDATTWEDFLQYTLEALRVLDGVPFRVLDLYDIARSRAHGLTEDGNLENGWHTFKRGSSLLFYRHQPDGLDGNIPAFIPFADLVDPPLPDGSRLNDHG